MTEFPIGWRCEWLIVKGFRPFDRAIRPKPGHVDYKTRADAELHKQRLLEHFGDDIVATVRPIYISLARRERLFKAKQDNLAADGWPIQMRPPRLGKKGRRK